MKGNVAETASNGQDRPGLFQRPLWVTLFALTAAVGWGWAYPLIKLGMVAFGIGAHMTGSKMLFAGLRFFLAGVIVLAVAGWSHRRFGLRKGSDAWFVLVYALLNTTLHYAFFYFGLSHNAGARSAILNSLSVFMVVILACVFFRSDRMTWRKATGCAVGFLGILTLNIGDKTTGGFTLLGDGMIVLNALCGATASLLTRGLGQRVDVVVGTGYSLALGGVLLMVPAVMAGCHLPVVTLRGVVILLLLVAISSVGFSLYNKLLSCNPVGKVAIFNSLIPVVGAVTSCLCLGEPFYWKYVAAGTLAAAGICIITRERQS